MTSPNTETALATRRRPDAAVADKPREPAAAAVGEPVRTVRTVRTVGTVRTGRMRRPPPRHPLALLLALLLALQLGARARSPQQQQLYSWESPPEPVNIIYDEETSYLVRIDAHHVNGTSGELCKGLLIAEMIILVPASCVNRTWIERIKVVNVKGEVRAVKEINYYQNVGNRRISGNIALLQISQSFQSYSTLDISDSLPNDNNICILESQIQERNMVFQVYKMLIFMPKSMCPSACLYEDVFCTKNYEELEDQCLMPTEVTVPLLHESRRIIGMTTQPECNPTTFLDVTYYNMWISYVIDKSINPRNDIPLLNFL